MSLPGCPQVVYFLANFGIFYLTAYSYTFHCKMLCLSSNAPPMKKIFFHRWCSSVARFHNSEERIVKMRLIQSLMCFTQLSPFHGIIVLDRLMRRGRAPCVDRNILSVHSASLTRGAFVIDRLQDSYSKHFSHPASRGAFAPPRRSVGNAQPHARAGI